MAFTGFPNYHLTTLGFPVVTFLRGGIELIRMLESNLDNSSIGKIRILSSLFLNETYSFFGVYMDSGKLSSG